MAIYNKHSAARARRDARRSAQNPPPPPRYAPPAPGATRGTYDDGTPVPTRDRGTPSTEDAPAQTPAPQRGRVDPNNLPPDVGAGWNYKAVSKYGTLPYGVSARGRFVGKPITPPRPIVAVDDKANVVTIMDPTFGGNVTLRPVVVGDAVVGLPPASSLQQSSPEAAASQKNNTATPEATQAQQGGFFQNILSSKWLLPAAGVLGLAFLI